MTSGRNLLRHPIRSALALAGIAVTAAMLLDMVLLAGGIERSFARMLLGRGFQIRLSPRGTLPFDTEATVAGAAGIARRVAADPDVAQVGPVLGTSVYAREADSLVTLFGYGIDPAAQTLYQLLRGADLAPGDTAGVLVSEPVVAALGVAPGDSLEVVGRLDPQVARAAVERRLVVRGVVRWLYDYRGQRSIGALVPVMQALAWQRAEDRVSMLVVRVVDDARVAAVVDRLKAAVPEVEVNSVANLVASFRQRLVYFRQLSIILGTISLGVTVLLISTLLTITVNERLGEIATLRAIGISRATVVRQVLGEGLLLTVMGGGLGVGLGIVTARYLDRILTSFPGLPAAISFFVPEPRSLVVAAVTLLVTGVAAGGYPAWLAARAPIAATLRSEAP
jgi:putative ABC transport system permease protein